MTNLRKFQILGAVGIILAYICFVLAAREKISVWYGWSVAGFVGIIELITIFVYDSNITRFVRNMYRRPADMAALFILLPLSWWLAGELFAAGVLIGWLNSHFHEKD